MYHHGSFTTQMQGECSLRLDVPQRHHAPWKEPGSEAALSASTHDAWKRPPCRGEGRWRTREAVQSQAPGNAGVRELFRLMVLVLVHNSMHLPPHTELSHNKKGKSDHISYASISISLAGKGRLFTFPLSQHE